jgi:hypothetical protein
VQAPSAKIRGGKLTEYCHSMGASSEATSVATKDALCIDERPSFDSHAAPNLPVRRVVCPPTLVSLGPPLPSASLTFVAPTCGRGRFGLGLVVQAEPVIMAAEAPQDGGDTVDKLQARASFYNMFK